MPAIVIAIKIGSPNSKPSVANQKKVPHRTRRMGERIEASTVIFYYI
jgi:hypothetical protein